MAEPGFQLWGEFYPIPASYRTSEMALVKHVCDMPFREWARAINADGADDPLLLSGAVAVAAWRANPQWTRSQAYEFGDRIVPDEVELVGLEEDDVEGDARPPEDGALSESSSSQSESLSESQESKPE